MAQPAKLLAWQHQSVCGRAYSAGMPRRNSSASPRHTRWTIGSAWMRGVADVLALHGLDVAALFGEAALDITLLARADSRFAVEGVDRLWALAEQRSGQPHIALTR